jgi:hypothetical protein
VSTYLQLCQKLRRECVNGYAGGPGAVTGQTGILEKIVGWVADAYKDIQILHDNWRWMRSNFTVNTVASDDTYAFADCTDTKTAAAISRFSHWHADDREDPFRAHLTSVGVSAQNWLIYLPYDEFRRIYKFGAQQTVTGQPVYASVDDDDQIVLGPNPSDIYTITGRYQRGPQILAANDDTPDMPTQYHDLILYYAMERYAVNSVAPEVLARARTEGARLLGALQRTQLPEIHMGGPLA